MRSQSSLLAPACLLQMGATSRAPRPFYFPALSWCCVAVVLVHAHSVVGVCIGRGRLTQVDLVHAPPPSSQACDQTGTSRRQPLRESLVIGYFKQNPELRNLGINVDTGLREAA